MLLIFAGLPGTGKSTLARGLASKLNATILDKDLVRDAMFGPDRVTFTTEQDDIVVEAMLQTAADLLRLHPSATVILDGRVFSKNSQLKRVTDFADSIPTRHLVIECTCSEASAKQRLAADIGKHIAANRTPELYDRVKARFEPVPNPKVIINTEQPLELCLELALSSIQQK